MPAPTSESSSALAPITSGLLAAALAEGGVAAVGALDSGGGAVAGAAALLAASATIVVAAAVPLALVGWLADREAARALGRGLTDALGGRPALATAAVLTALGLGVGLGAVVGARLGAMMTARFAAGGTAAVTGVGVALFGLAVAPAARAIGGRLGARGRSAGARWALVGVVAVAALAVTLATLPVAWAFAPTAFALGFGLGLAARAQRMARAARGWRGPAALAAATLVSAAPLVFADALPSAAQSALLYRSPWAGNLLAAAAKASDADGDGYAAILLGGDCDDADPARHPGAEDVPGNGIDENCTGADAQRYAPPPAPRARAEGVPRRQNVVLIQMDALRPDHLSFAGYERETTPRLDRFFAEAAWFDRAYTPAPSTRFAMSAMFTGRDPRRVPHDDLGGNRYRMRPEAETIAEILTRAGYQTMGYTITYVVQHNQGLGQGFARWVTPWPVDDWLANYPVAAERTTDASLAYLASVGDTAARPYLLFAHYRCTHDPYIAYDEFPYGDAEVDRYDSALSYCDREIGRLLDGLDARDDRARTTVVIFSDHGEMFGEHGLTNHGNSLFENDVRVLLAARIPGVAPRRVEAPVLLTDLAPTVLDVAGLPPRADDGWSLLAQLGDDVPARSLFMFTDLWRGNVHQQASAIVEWPLKLIRDVRTNVTALYDVAEDPEEEDDLSSARAADRARLAERLESYEAYAVQPAR